MSQKLKKEYLENIKTRYRKSNKEQKTAILNEFCLDYQLYYRIL